MIFPFDKLNVDVSCVGNHELDKGIDKAYELIKRTKSTWVMSNLLEIDKNYKPIAGAKPYHIIEK